MKAIINTKYGSPDVLKLEDIQKPTPGDDNHLYYLDAADGSLLWKYRTGDLINCKPYYYEGAIFFGSRDGYFYCVDAGD